MAEKKNIMTYAGLKKLEDELQDLKVNRRQEVAEKIRECDINTMTPIEAMNLLFELKKILS